MQDPLLRDGYNRQTYKDQAFFKAAVLNPKNSRESKGGRGERPVEGRHFFPSRDERRFMRGDADCFTIQLRTVDHSARGSMKNAASCVN